MIAHPLVLFAQQPAKIRRVGYLYDSVRPEPFDTSVPGAFARGMHERGISKARTSSSSGAFADGKRERLLDLAADLVRANVEVIVSNSTPTTHALQKATNTIPIVMATSFDPVASGFIKSLARPGGNITGLSNMISELRAKQLEMLRAVTPKLARMAALFNPDNPANIDGVKILQVAARKLGVSVVSIQARTAQQIEDAFALMAEESIQAILVLQESLFIRHRHQIAKAVLRLRLPSIAPTQDFAEAGLLMSYGPNFRDMYRRAAVFVDRYSKERSQPICRSSSRCVSTWS